MPTKHENALSRDFAILRNRLRCVFCKADQEDRPVIDEDIAEVLTDLEGIPWIDECKLYRYSDADEWNICNLCKQQLRLSKVGDLNDMFEGIIPPQKQLTEKDLEVFGELAYVKCFSENWNNLLMWAHYADGGRGMCVEYNLTWLPDNDPIFHHLYPVHYTEQRYTPTDFAEETENIMGKGCPSAQQEYWSKRMLAYHLVKSMDWKYEQEWRLVIPAGEVHDSGNKLKIKNHLLPFHCVSAVYLGSKMPQEKKNQIRDVVNQLNKKVPVPIEIREIDMEEGSYALNAK